MFCLNTDKRTHTFSRPILCFPVSKVVSSSVFLKTALEQLMKPEWYPQRKTATFTDRLLDLVKRNPGLSKEKFEEIARKNGYRRSTIRDFIDHGIVGGVLAYDRRKLSVKSIQSKAMAKAAVLFDN
jgi:hypothetical protein